MSDLLNIEGLAEKIGLSVEGVRGRIQRAKKQKRSIEDFLPKPQRRNKGESYFWNQEVVETWLEDF
jgi:hypothetical protein